MSTTPTTQEKKPRLPTTLSKKWVGYVLGFMVAVAVGLAPFLGRTEVPLFTPLLSLFPKLPDDNSTRIIPLSAFIMGFVCVIVQYFSHEQLNKKYLKKLFKRSALAVILATIILFILHTLVVVQVKLPTMNTEVSILVGFYRPDSCKECDLNMSNAECLKHTTLDPVTIKSCWGERNIQIAYIILSLCYFTMTGGFGAMIGWLILREKLKLKTPT